MKIFSLLTLGFALLLSACSPQQFTRVVEEQPIPLIETQPTNESASVSPDLLPTTGYTPVKVVDVNVEVGVGSPIPVFVDVGADLPDVCAQVDYVNIIQDGSTFKINLGTTPSSEADCLRDTYPFRMKIPLNVADLPVGTYSVDVNGIRSDFKIDTSASTATELLTADSPIVKRDVQVDNITIDVGLGSPLPVHAIVSANLPNGCSQLGEIQMHRDGNTFYVRLISFMPAETECKPDPLPVRLEIPLNLFLLSDGKYEVNVNGTTANFNIPIQ